MGWVQCVDCDDYWCTEHDLHVADCECPPIEEWMELKKDPYFSVGEDSNG